MSELLWITHEGRGLSRHESQGLGSPVNVSSSTGRKHACDVTDRTARPVDSPWSRQPGRRLQPSLSGRPRLSACRVVLFEHEWCGARTSTPCLRAGTGPGTGAGERRAGMEAVRAVTSISARELSVGANLPRLHGSSVVLTCTTSAGRR